MSEERRTVEVQSDSVGPIAGLIGLIVVVAAVLVVLFYWHPWSTTSSTNSTTITQPAPGGAQQSHTNSSSTTQSH